MLAKQELTELISNMEEKLHKIDQIITEAKAAKEKLEKKAEKELTKLQAVKELQANEIN